MAWSSTLIYGQGFPAKEPAKVSAWHDVSTAQGTAALDPAVIMNPNVVPPAATLSLTNTGGSGIVGWANRGIGGEGLVFQGGRDYEGYAMALAPSGGSLQVALVDRSAGNATLASVTLQVPPSPDWQKVSWQGLTPSASTSCTGIPWGSDPSVDCGEPPKDGMNPGIVCVKCGGEVSIGLASQGALHLGFVTLQPGAWGRLGDLPVLKSGTDMIQAMGFQSIRQGGSVSYSLRWKDWRGAPEQRAAMNHVWGPDLVAPWSPFDFVDMANALDIMPIVTLACDLNNATDWGDLVEYLYGDESTEWGAVRIHNDSHPAPYKIDTFELVSGGDRGARIAHHTDSHLFSLHCLPPLVSLQGNEQENPDFLAQLQAIEARRATIPGAPQWYFMYPENVGPNASVSAAIVASGISGDRVMADCHVGASGGVPCAEASAIWQGFNGSGINCETNAVTSHLQRGVEEMADLITWFNQPANVSRRLRARTASFCIQRSGQMRDIWDQGLSFFLPNMTWLQPPGVVHAMLAATWQPNALGVSLTGGSSGSGPGVTAAAQMASDRSSVVVQLANAVWGSVPGNATIALKGFAPAAGVDLWLMAEPGTGAVNSTAGNTPADPTYIQAVHSTLTWPAGAGQITVALPPLSAAVLVFHSA